MHHPRVTIFAAALSALGVMSFLSALLGNILPGLLPKQYTTAAAAILFFVFGAKMLREGLEMEGGEAGREKMEEEMREVQKEVQEVEEEVIGRPGGHALDEAEEGRSMLRGSPSDGEDGLLPTPVVSGSNSGRGGRKAKDALNSVSEGVKNLAQLLFSPIFIQAFVLTFLAEWGDRSQITTIALGAAHVSRLAKKISWQTRSTGKLALTPSSLFLSLERAERLDRHDGYYPRSLDLHRRRRPRWAMDLATHLDQAWCVSRHFRCRERRRKERRADRIPPPSPMIVTLGGAVLFLIFGVMYSYEAIYFIDEAPLA